MIIINTVDDRYFSLNGVNYAKIYQPLKQGEESIGIYNTMDTRQQLVNSTAFNEFTIDGVIPLSQADAIAALLPLIYLEDATFEIVQNITENITNNPDEEDITTDSGVLKFKDRNSVIGGQRGYKIIRPNFDFSAIPSDYANCIWEIRYAHDLLGKSINIPNNVEMVFNGGVFINGNINLLRTKITAGLYRIFGNNTTVTGIIDNEKIYIEWFGAVGDWSAVSKSGTNNTPFLQMMFSFIDQMVKTTNPAGGQQSIEGVKISSGKGVFGLSSTVNTGVAAINMDFSGVYQTIFAANPTFESGTPLFRMGSKDIQRNSLSTSLSNCSFNCAAVTGVRGFEFYGLRDSSRIENILITGFTHEAVYSDYGGSNGGAFMTEGLIMSNVHAISFVHVSGAIFDLGGMFECTIIGGKAILNGLDRSGDIIGYRVGRTQCRGVAIIGCSAGGYFGSGNKVGIAYENARNCWDDKCTFENINGFNVEFGKTQQALICQSMNGRHYVSDPIRITRNAKALFKTANSCTFKTASSSANAKAVEFATGSMQCCAEISVINGDIAAIKNTSVIFSGGNENSAKGYSSASQAFWGLNSTNNSGDIYDNGTKFNHDQFWSTLRFGDQNKYRIVDNQNNVMMRVDGATGTIYIDTANVVMENLRTTSAAGHIYNDLGTIKIG